MTIKILHLYYDIMNLYGDYGNVCILQKHLEDQNVNVTVDKKTIGDEIDFLQYNFIYIGSGTEKNLDCVLNDIKKYKESLEKYINDGKVLLATGNSFEMFGKNIDKMECLKIFDFEVSRLSERETMDIIYTSKFLKNKVIGFVNKMTNIYHNMNPFFSVEFGIGENENKDYEGVKYKNFYGTHISGPILVRNPELLEYLLKTICQSLDKNFKYKEIKYDNEEEGYKLTLSELENRKNH